MSLSGYNEIKPENYYDFTFAWMSEVFRILKDSGSMYVFSGWNNLKDILRALDDVGFVTINHIIWKYQFGVVTKRNLLHRTIIVFMFVKMIKKENSFLFLDSKKMKRKDGSSLHYQDKEDVWDIKREYWTGDEKTPTKLPSELNSKIIGIL